CWQLFPANAQQIDALAARDLYHRHSIFLCDICNRAELLRCGHATIDPWNNTESSVFLNVRVNSVVDEPCVAFIDVVFSPDSSQQRCQTDFAFRIFVTVGESSEHSGDAAKPEFFYFDDEIRFCERNTGDVVMNGRIFDCAFTYGFEDLLY